MDELTLDGDPGPDPPAFCRTGSIMTRVPKAVELWVNDQAAARAVTRSMWLRRHLEEQMAGDRTSGLPPDCLRWLDVQAAQLGQPHEPEWALIVVLRSLAAKYPTGVRLNDGPS